MNSTKNASAHVRANLFDHRCPNLGSGLTCDVYEDFSGDRHAVLPASCKSGSGSRYVVPMSITGGSGRKHLGERGYIPIRPPLDQKQTYSERAEALGISLGSWSVMRLAQAEGLPVPDYINDELARGAARRESLAAQAQFDLEDGGGPVARAG